MRCDLASSTKSAVLQPVAVLIGVVPTTHYLPEERGNKIGSQSAVKFKAGLGRRWGRDLAQALVPPRRSRAIRELAIIPRFWLFPFIFT